MKSWMLIGALALAGLAGCDNGGDTIIASGETKDQIQVLGMATVKAVPDMARADLGVQVFADSLADALAQNSARAGAVIAALKEKGVEERDLRTTSFNIVPQYDYREGSRPGELVGYWVNNSVAVNVRQLERLGEILQAGIDAGANTVGGIVFAVDDPDSLWQEARLQAMQDARRRAEVLAEAAGMKLGKAMRINENSFGTPVPILRGALDKASEGASVPVEPGELEVTVQVEVVFELL
jgi:uncharacterized protein YggE